MEIKVDIVQPDASEVVRGRQLEPEPAPPIPPIAQGHKSTFKKAEKQGKEHQEEQQKDKPSSRDVNELVKETQNYLEDLNIRLNFEVREETGEMVVRVLNKDTDELIRQIPPEDVIKLREKLVELRGVLFDTKV